MIVIGSGNTGAKLALLFDENALLFSTAEQDSNNYLDKNIVVISKKGASKRFNSGVKIWDRNYEKLRETLDEIEDENVIIFSALGGGCFTPDMEVLTNNGYKKIKDIEVGELVLTKNNTFEKVLDVYKKEWNDKIIIIELENDIVLKCTPDHKILVRRDGEKIYVKAEDLNESDDLVFVESDGSNGED